MPSHSTFSIWESLSRHNILLVLHPPSGLLFPKLKSILNELRFLEVPKCGTEIEHLPERRIPQASGKSEELLYKQQESILKEIKLD